MENNFNIQRKERISAEDKRRYNERFDNIYAEINNINDEEENKSHMKNIIKKFRGGKISDEGLEQIVLDAIWESAKKDVDSKGNKLENHLSYFRAIVNNRLKDAFRYDKGFKGQTENQLLGKIRKYKNNKENLNESFTEEEMLEVIGITKEKYMELIQKDNNKNTLSLDFNNGSSSNEGEINFYDNFGCQEEGFNEVEEGNGWVDLKTEEEKYEETHGEVKEAFKMVFSKNKADDFFETLIRIEVNGETQIEYAKECGLANTSISARMGYINRDREKIILALNLIRENKLKSNEEIKKIYKEKIKELKGI